MRPSHRRSQRTAAVLLAALLAVAGCRPSASDAAPLSAQDVAAIKSTLTTWKEASLAGDWPAFFGQFTDDAVWMGPKGASVEGLATIRQGTWFRALEEELVPVQSTELSAFGPRGTAKTRRPGFRARSPRSSNSVQRARPDSWSEKK